MTPRAIRAATGARQPDVVPVPGGFFVTHPDSILALTAVECFPGMIWECACGDGAMAERLKSDRSDVYATDLHDRGYVDGRTVDFLTAALPPGIDHIVTNPPFELAEAFVRHALELNPPGKIAMFLRTVWLEGSGRYARIWSRRPPARVWVFISRQPLRRDGGRWQSGLISFSWYIWDRDHVGAPVLGWLPTPRP